MLAEGLWMREEEEKSQRSVAERGQKQNQIWEGAKAENTRFLRRGTMVETELFWAWETEWQAPSWCLTGCSSPDGKEPLLWVSEWFIGSPNRYWNLYLWEDRVPRGSHSQWVSWGMGRGDTLSTVSAGREAGQPISMSAMLRRYRNRLSHNLKL